MNKVLKILGGLFFTIGIFFVGAGIFVKISYDNFLKTAVKTTATITSIGASHDNDGDVNHSVIVEFVVDGKTYSGELNYYSSSMRIGREETIYYNPENPNDFRSKGGSFLIWLFIFIGGLFAGIGIILIIVMIVQSKKKKRVLSYNYVIQASIVGFSLDTSTSVNGRCPYRLDATYISPIDGKLYTYKSDQLWADLTPILEQRQITTIPVYVNPNNYAEYYVDISSLKNLIGN